MVYPTMPIKPHPSVPHPLPSWKLENSHCFPNFQQKTKGSEKKMHVEKGDTENCGFILLLHQLQPENLLLSLVFSILLEPKDEKKWNYSILLLTQIGCLRSATIIICAVGWSWNQLGVSRQTQIASLPPSAPQTHNFSWVQHVLATCNPFCCRAALKTRNFCCNSSVTRSEALFTLLFLIKGKPGNRTSLDFITNISDSVMNWRVTFIKR